MGLSSVSVGSSLQLAALFAAYERRLLCSVAVIWHCRSDFPLVCPASIAIDKRPTRMASIEAPIGASVIDYIQRNNNHDHEAPTATDNGPPAGLEEITTQTIPSLIPTHKSSNMILCGPCKSGRSSMVMNMAHSLAASHGDHCRSGHCGSASCCCPDVVILTPLLEGKHERFPLSCHVVEESLPLDFYGQLRALQQSNHAEEPNKTTSWNKAALRRIQVHRMSSICNVMEYLLSFQGRNENPMSAIIVEDLDIFVRGDASCGDLTTEQLMLMTQTRK